MSQELIEISGVPKYSEFLKGLDTIRGNLIEPNGNELPEGHQYLINQDGSVSFVERDEGREFPPFTYANLLLDHENGFAIDYEKADIFYNQNKELALKEINQTLGSNEFRPSSLVETLIQQQQKEVENLLTVPENNLSHKDIEKLMNDHMTKIENLLDDYTNKIQQAPKRDIGTLQRELREKIAEIFKHLKESLQQKLTGIRESTKASIKNTVNDAKISANNFVASNMQKVNDKVKNLTNTIDEKFKVIEKEIKTDSVVENLENKPKQSEEVKTNSLAENSEDKPKQSDSRIKVSDSVAPNLSQTVLLHQNNDLKKQNNKLEQQNKGLKTFVNVVKEKHPDVYEKVFTSMQKATQEVSKENDQKITEDRKQKAGMQL